MMDLTKLSTDDLMALQAGDLSRVSTQGLQQLRAHSLGVKVKAQEDADRAEYDPTRDMGTGARFLAGVGKGMTDLARGAAQRVGLMDQRQIDAARKTDAPLMATTAGVVGNVAGNVAVALPTAFIPGANTVSGAAGVGALQGFLQPTSGDESAAKNALIGGGLGGGSVLIGRGINALYQGAKGIIEPFTQSGRNKIAGRTIERFATKPGAIASASSAQTATGAAPTLAEATQDTGIASLQRAVEQMDPAAAALAQERLMSNNAARINTIADIAGTPAKRAAAEAARDASAGEMYRAATAATYKVDQELSDLLGRPAVKQAMQRAKTLAENQGRSFAFDVSANNPMSGVGVTTQTSRQITGQGLQDLKMAMDEMLSDPTSGFTGKAGDTIKSLRGKLIGWMESANPDFRSARVGYAEASKPINAMDVGERLLEKTTSATRDFAGNRRLHANALARALNNEEQTVRAATGFNGVNALSDVLTPDQLAKIDAVRRETELVANLAQAANGPGSQTAKSLASQNILRQVLGPTGLPQSWAESALLQTFMRPVQFAYASAEPRITEQLAKALLDPDVAKAVLASNTQRQLPNALATAMPLARVAAQQSVPAAGLVSRQR